MDYQKFIHQLPNLYENWGQESIHPKSNQFQQVLEQVSGWTTPNVLQLLNFAVECMEADEIYCEVGCFHGSTLIGALLGHPDCKAYAVDNFSEEFNSGSDLDILLENLSKFNLEDQVCFCNQDVEEFFADLRKIAIGDKIGVYFYDGSHDYRSQLLGLLLVKPFLADRALIVIDDSNWSEVKQADWDFIATNPKCKFLLELSTPQNGYGSFWNGLQILSWDASSKYNYEWSVFEQAREEAIIKAIYNCQSRLIKKQNKSN